MERGTRAETLSNEDGTEEESGGDEGTEEDGTEEESGVDEEKDDNSYINNNTFGSGNRHWTQRA